MNARTQPASEVPLSFDCQQDGGPVQLIGILCLPQTPAPRGVLIVTGGPQYRAGSHRQFVLLSRALAAHGVPVLRFDYRGMGDSEGAVRDYRAISADIDAALAQFFASVPLLREVVLWGLCDGATASACHTSRDARISGLVLLNPWVRSSAGLARATLHHYYLPRLLQGSFWRKFARCELELKASLAGIRHSASHLVSSSDITGRGDGENTPAEQIYPTLHGYKGRVLLILSGKDLVAREWQMLVSSSKRWRSLIEREKWQQIFIEDANHTFASAAWREQVELRCLEWLYSW